MALQALLIGILRGVLHVPLMPKDSDRNLGLPRKLIFNDFFPLLFSGYRVAPGALSLACMVALRLLAGNICIVVLSTVLACNLPELRFSF